MCNSQSKRGYPNTKNSLPENAQITGKKVSK